MVKIAIMRGARSRIPDRRGGFGRNRRVPADIVDAMRDERHFGATFRRKGLVFLQVRSYKPRFSRFDGAGVELRSLARKCFNWCRYES